MQDAPFRCRSRTIMEAFPSRTVFICHKEWAGDADKADESGRARACHVSRPSRRSRWRRSPKPSPAVSRKGTVLMDAGYGVNTALRDGVTALGLSYVAGVLPQTSVCRRGRPALPPKPWTGRGPPPKLIAPRWRASACIGQGACREPAAIGLLKQSFGAKALASPFPRVLPGCALHPAHRE